MRGRGPAAKAWNDLWVKLAHCLFTLHLSRSSKGYGYGIAGG